MKKIVKIFFFTFLLVMYSCLSHDSSLKGRWIVENISFDFDERRNTPDMISQFGEEESRNELIFKNDSVVYIKMLGFNGDYQYFVNEKSEIIFKDKSSLFGELGVIKDNKIYSEQNTAIGKMKIIFVKE